MKYTKMLSLVIVFVLAFGVLAFAQSCGTNDVAEEATETIEEQTDDDMLY